MSTVLIYVQNDCRTRSKEISNRNNSMKKIKNKENVYVGILEWKKKRLWMNRRIILTSGLLKCN